MFYLGADLNFLGLLGESQAEFDLVKRAAVAKAHGRLPCGPSRAAGRSLDPW